MTPPIDYQDSIGKQREQAEVRFFVRVFLAAFVSFLIALVWGGV